MARPGRLELPTLCLEDTQYKTLRPAAGVAYEGARHLSRPWIGLKVDWNVVDSPRWPKGQLMTGLPSPTLPPATRQINLTDPRSSCS